MCLNAHQLQRSPELAKALKLIKHYPSINIPKTPPQLCHLQCQVSLGYKLRQLCSFKSRDNFKEHWTAVKGVCWGISLQCTVSLHHGVFNPSLLPFQQPQEPFCAGTHSPQPLWAHQNRFCTFSRVWLACLFLLFSKVTTVAVPLASLLPPLHTPPWSLANLSGKENKWCQGRSTPIPAHLHGQ